MANLTVSVVTPSYQQASFLEETVRSVLDQDYAAIEYRIMDGGSTDGSVDIIRKYQSRLASWVSSPDGGQARAINEGWRLSGGEILAYLNADDRYLPGTVCQVAEFFDCHPDVDIVYGSCYSEFPQNGTRVLYCPPPFHFRRLLLENFIPQPTVFIRRKVLDRVGWLDPSLRYCLDYDFWLRSAAQGIAFRLLPKIPLAIFRVWPGSKTSNDPEGWVTERVSVLDKILMGSIDEIRDEKFRHYVHARSYVTVAYALSLNDNLSLVRSFLNRAFHISPRILGDPQFLKIHLASVLGVSGARWTRSLKISFIEKFVS